ncbi:MAG: hypothetical protein EBR01_14425 [Proteobacteria bacterium]|nr:hypothetical protein [Pseudomonadota bacterium]
MTIHEQSRKLFLEILNMEELPKGCSVGEMQEFVIAKAHEMVRAEKISWEMFGRIVDEALCY